MMRVIEAPVLLAEGGLCLVSGIEVMKVILAFIEGSFEGEFGGNIEGIGLVKGILLLGIICHIYYY